MGASLDGSCHGFICRQRLVSCCDLVSLFDLIDYGLCNVLASFSAVANFGFSSMCLGTMAISGR